MLGRCLKGNLIALGEMRFGNIFYFLKNILDFFLNIGKMYIMRVIANNILLLPRNQLLK